LKLPIPVITWSKLADQRQDGGANWCRQVRPPLNHILQIRVDWTFRVFICCAMRCA
jgi:hypothetical protein